MNPSSSASAVRRALLILVCSIATLPVFAGSPNLVLSQVYGGGGNTGAPYTNDFIEVYNRGPVSVSLVGLSVQYGSAAGSFTQVTAIGTGAVTSLSPGQYYLVQEAVGAVGVALPTPDASGAIALSASAGKVALVNGTTALNCGQTSGTPAPCSSGQLGQIIDLIGFGSTATLFEGAFAPAPSNTTADIRGSGGCTDINNNGSDFTAGAPTPRNSSSSNTPCTASLPTSLNAVATSGQVVLTWNGTTNGASYDLKRSTVSGGPYTTIAAALTTPTYTDTAVTDGTTYFYVVAGVVNGASSANSSEVSATPSAPGDTTPPTVSTFLAASANPTNGSVVTYTLTFSEVVTGVDATDFSYVVNPVTPMTATVDTPTTSDGITWTVPVTVTGSGTVQLFLDDNDSILDTASNPLAGVGTSTAYAPGAVFTVDHIAPSVLSSDRANADPTAAASVAFTVTFSEAVIGVDTSDFTVSATGVTGTGINSVSGSGTTYTVTVGTGSGTTGTIRLDVNAAATITDAAGNGLAAGFTGGQSYTVDRTAPSVVSVTRVGSSPTSSSTVAFTVTFSDIVSGVDASDFSATVAGLTGANVTGVTGSGAVYTVSVNTGTGDGTLRLDVLNDGSIVNGSSVALTAPFTGGEIYTIDKTAPTVQSIVRSGLAVTNAASVQYTVTFSESVTGVTASSFPVTSTGVTGAAVSTVTGSGAVYTVTVNTGSGDGTVRLDFVGGSAVVDAASNPDSTNFTTGDSITIDKTVPVVQSITTVDANPSSATTVTFAVTFSESVSGVDATDFTITAPGLTATSVASVSGSGTAYTVIVNTGGGDGSLRLDLTGDGTVQDVAGNAAATFTGGASYTMQGTPANPTGLGATAGDAHVALAWTAASGATSYNVRRATVSGGPYTTLNGAVVATTYDDLTAVNGTPYFYVVSSNGTRSPSSNSNEVTATATAPPANTSGLVISQVYGGGGNAGAFYTNDFVEIFNKGTQPVSLTGWSVQYLSATGSGSWAVTPLSGSIAAGHYFLVKEGVGAGGTSPLPTPDTTGTINMSATAGKVALANVLTQLSGCVSPSATVADLVGFGTTANCFEGAGPTPPPSNTNALFRAAGGCTDTDSNVADFTAAAASPRNTSSPAGNCSGFAATGTATPSAVDAGGTSVLAVTITPGAAPTSTGIGVTIDLTAIGGSATQMMFDDGTNGDGTIGDDVFTYSAIVSAAASNGLKNLTVTATDAQARSTGTNIQLTITPPLSTIADAKVDADSNTVPDLLGQLVKVRGVVTSIDFRGGTGVEYYIQDATGGIDLFNTATDFGPFTIGANIEVVGTIAQFSGLTELTPTSISTVSGLPAVVPQTITLSQLADGVGEPLEGKLVTVSNVTITSGSYPASGASGNVTISDGTGTSVLRVDSDTDLDGTVAPTGSFTLTGIVSQSDTTAPFDAAYQILPRGLGDVAEQTPPYGNGIATPASVIPGGTTLLTVAAFPGQSPPSTGVTVTADLSSIGLSASQPMFDDGSHGDATALDGTYSFSATVDGATSLGQKALPFTVADSQTRSTAGNITLTIQSVLAPPAPSGLVATPGSLQVGLTWSASAGATSYTVKRSTVSGGPYTIVASGVATNSYNDVTVSNGTRYYYIVTATNGNESGPSNEANALPAAIPPTGSLAKVYFIDIGQGASTLIVGPTGKTLLVDGGPTGQGSAKVVPLLNTLGLTIDNSILTHYHIDHDDGLTEVINAGKFSPTATAYDNGDTPALQPPNAGSTKTAYLNYVAAVNSHAGITRVRPEDVGGALAGTVIDLGGGMKATILGQGGKLLSGGQVAIDNSDLNTESISVLVEYNNFDFVVSGDMTGGGSTDTAKTPDVETFVGQMAGDIDVLEFDHHGSTTANNRRYLKLLKAEVAEAEAGYTNTFGHPNRETVNKFLNIPATSGNTYTGTALPAPGNGPVAYQTDPSPATDDRVTRQGYSGAGPANAGQGTLLLNTDGTTSYTLESFDDGGVRLAAAQHVYALDATNPGVTTNFPPTVQPVITPAVPLATDTVTVSASVHDREDAITSVTLTYSLNGTAQTPVVMSLSSGSYTATIPAQPDATRVDYNVTAMAGGQSTSFASGYFAGTTPIATLRALDPKGEPLYYEYAARVQGVVTAGTGRFASGTNDDYLQDATGAIDIWRTIQPSTPVVQTTNEGSTYSVAGLIGTGSGRFRLEVTPPFVQPTTPYLITFVSSGTVPTPLSKTIAQINAGAEGFEGQLITISNCTITSGTIPSSPAALDGFLTVSDGTGTLQLKVDHNTDVPGMATPSGSFAITGILQQDDFLRPFDSGYDIAPRSRTDLGGSSSSGPGQITIADARIDVDGSGNTPGDYVPDLLNQTVHVQGVVTSINFRSSNGSGIEYYIQDSTAGVDVFSTATTRALNVGDDVDVIATMKQFNGLSEIDPGATLSNLTVLAPGTLPAVNPQIVTCAQLADNGVGEPLEGRLLRINNVTLSSPPATWAASTNYVITDSTGTATLRISASTNLVGVAPPSGVFSVVGVLGQFDSAAPFDSGYQFIPSSTADMQAAVATPSSITATAGASQTAIINTPFATALGATVKDSGSNPVANVNVTFDAPSSGPSGTFGANGTSVTVVTDVNGVATAPAFSANGATGSYAVTATINALTATFPLTNTPQAATHLSVSAPGTVTAGTPFNITVSALDLSNSVVTSYTGTVHFASSASGALPSDYTFLAGDSGTHTFSVTLDSSGPQSVTVSDASNGLSGTANLTVNAITPVATHYSVTAPSTATAGTPFSVTVTALDASNAAVTGYTGTAHFTSPGSGALPADYTFVAGDSGSHTFSATLTSTGNQTVTATDTSSAITGTSGSIAVSLPIATHFSVAVPGSAVAGTAFNATVTALDASNATVTGYVGTVHFTSSSAGTLPTDYTFVGGDSGSHVFAVTLTSPGSQSITATDVSTAINGTGSVLVSAPTATNFSLTAPANASAGAPFNVTVTARDASNATVTGYTGTVHFTSTGTGTLPSDYTFVGGDGGSHTFSVTLLSVGSQTVTATDTSTAITGTSNAITITSVPATHFSVTAPASAAAGAPFSVTVTALDAGGAPVADYSGTVHFTATGASTLPADYTFGPSDSGVQMFSVTLGTTGTQTVTVTDLSSSITGASNVNVTAGCLPITVTASNDGPSCRAHDVHLHASTTAVGATFSWSGPAGFHSIEQNPLATRAGTYTVTATVAGGCADSATTTVSELPAPTIVIPPSIAVCGPQQVTIPVTLTGTGPWHIVWSDGLSQNVSDSHPVRIFDATADVTLAIVSLSDSSCSVGAPAANVLQIHVDSAPAIVSQPAMVAPTAGGAVGAVTGPVTLAVVASGNGLHYQWYFQEHNGVAQPVGGDSASFVLADTSHAQSTVWVVISNSCGSVESTHLAAGPGGAGRRRAAGH